MSRVSLTSFLRAQRTGRPANDEAQTKTRGMKLTSPPTEKNDPKKMTRRLMLGLSAAGAASAVTGMPRRSLGSIAYCNGQPYETTTQCCTLCGAVYRIKPKTANNNCNWGCCVNGTSGLPYDGAVECCVSCGGYNQILAKLSNGTCNWGCCWNGSNGQPYNPLTQCCQPCGGVYQVINKLPNGTCNWGCCTNGQFYDGGTQCCISCGGVYSVKDKLANGTCNWGCCNGNWYNPLSQYCCSSNVVCMNGQACMGTYCA